MLAETGACASKLLTGSIFPLVAIRLRIFPCSTWVVRIGTASLRRETKAASKPTAAKIAITVTGQRRGCGLFPFNGMRRKAQALIYHSCAATRDAMLLSVLGWLDATGGCLASISGR